MKIAAERELPRVHLIAGQLLVTREPAIVTTVLGSCVAVTMFDPPSALAAICHVMLVAPAPQEPLPRDDVKRFRYVTEAVPEMIEAFRGAEVLTRSVEVKLFGGANVIGHSAADDPHWIGGANLAAARRLLEEANFAVCAENTGGAHGRKILFNTGTGEVLHKFLRRLRA